MKVEIELVPILYPGSWAVWLWAQAGLDMTGAITCIPYTRRRGISFVAVFPAGPNSGSDDG